MGNSFLIITIVMHVAAGVISAGVVYAKGYRDWKVAALLALGTCLTVVGLVMAAIMPRAGAPRADAAAPANLGVKAVPLWGWVAMVLWAAVYFGSFYMSTHVPPIAPKPAASAASAPVVNTPCPGEGNFTGTAEQCEQLKTALSHLFAQHHTFEPTSAAQYAAGYAASAEQADAMYKGRTLLITGQVKAVNETAVDIDAGEHSVRAALLPVQPSFDLEKKDGINPIIPAKDRVRTSLGHEQSFLCTGGGMEAGIALLQSCVVMDASN